MNEFWRYIGICVLVITLAGIVSFNPTVWDRLISGGAKLLEKVR